MTRHKKRILFVTQMILDFIKQDHDFMKGHFEVKALKLNSVSEVFKKLSRVIAEINKSDLIVIWWGNPVGALVATIARLAGKKVALFGGGYDVVAVPDIDYGLPLHPIGKYLGKLAYLMANEAIMFSHHSNEELHQNYNISKGKVIYFGLEPGKHKPKGIKKNIVITVGEVRRSNLKREGLEPFVKAAARLPKTEFRLIGAHCDDSIDYLKSIATENVKFLDLGYDAQKIIPHMQEAKVYVQASGHEGFGLAMAESMLCECVPVVTDRGAIREVVGTTGVYVNFNDEQSLAGGIKQALKQTSGKKARERILTKYPVNTRNEKLYITICRLLDIKATSEDASKVASNYRSGE